MWFFAQLTSPNTFYHLYTKNIDVEEQNGIFESHKLQYLPLIFHKLRIPFFLAWIASTKNEKKIKERIMQLFNLLSIICQFDSLRQ